MARPTQVACPHNSSFRRAQRALARPPVYTSTQTHSPEQLHLSRHTTSPRSPHEFTWFTRTTSPGLPHDFTRFARTTSPGSPDDFTRLARMTSPGSPERPHPSFLPNDLARLLPERPHPSFARDLTRVFCMSFLHEFFAQFFHPIFLNKFSTRVPHVVRAHPRTTELLVRTHVDQMMVICLQTPSNIYGRVGGYVTRTTHAQRPS